MTAPLKSSFYASLCLPGKSTDFLGRRLRTRPLLLRSTEIQNPPFPNATISTLKVLIAIFTEFNSEGIGAYSG